MVPRSGSDISSAGAVASGVAGRDGPTDGKASWNRGSKPAGTFAPSARIVPQDFHSGLRGSRPHRRAGADGRGRAELDAPGTTVAFHASSVKGALNRSFHSWPSISS